MKTLKEIMENIQLSGIDKVVRDNKVIGTIMKSRTNTYTAHHHASGQYSAGHEGKLDAAHALDAMHAEYSKKKKAA